MATKQENQKVTPASVLQKAKAPAENTAASRDGSSEQEKSSDFDSQIVRQAFIRKVFLILTVQLLVTSLIVAPLLFIEPARKVLTDDRRIFIAAIIVFWVLYSVVVCCYGISRIWPQNYIMLGLLTFSLAIIIACTCAELNFTEILIGISCTAALCFTLGALASLSVFDFTILTGALSSFLFTLFVLILLHFLMPSKTLMWIILSFGMTLLVLYFLIDIQIIVQKKHRYVLTPEDYVAAATLLYVDIVYIFTFFVLLLIRKV